MRAGCAFLQSSLTLAFMEPGKLLPEASWAQRGASDPGAAAAAAGSLVAALRHSDAGAQQLHHLHHLAQQRQRSRLHLAAPHVVPAPAPATAPQQPNLTLRQDDLAACFSGPLPESFHPPTAGLHPSRDAHSLPIHQAAAGDPSLPSCSNPCCVSTMLLNAAYSEPAGGSPAPPWQGGAHPLPAHHAAVHHHAPPPQHPPQHDGEQLQQAPWSPAPAAVPSPSFAPPWPVYRVHSAVPLSPRSLQEAGASAPCHLDGGADEAAAQQLHAFPAAGLEQAPTTGDALLPGFRLLGPPSELPFQRRSSPPMAWGAPPPPPPPPPQQQQQQLLADPDSQLADAAPGEEKAPMQQHLQEEVHVRMYVCDEGRLSRVKILPPLPPQQLHHAPGAAAAHRLGLFSPLVHALAQRQQQQQQDLASSTATAAAASASASAPLPGFAPPHPDGAQQLHVASHGCYGSSGGGAAACVRTVMATTPGPPPQQHHHDHHHHQQPCAQCFGSDRSACGAWEPQAAWPFSAPSALHVSAGHGHGYFASPRQQQQQPAARPWGQVGLHAPVAAATSPLPVLHVMPVRAEQGLGLGSGIRSPPPPNQRAAPAPPSVPLRVVEVVPLHVAGTELFARFAGSAGAHGSGALASAAAAAIECTSPPPPPAAAAASTGEAHKWRGGQPHQQHAGAEVVFFEPAEGAGEACQPDAWGGCGGGLPHGENDAMATDDGPCSQHECPGQHAEMHMMQHERQQQQHAEEARMELRHEEQVAAADGWRRPDPSSLYARQLHEVQRLPPRGEAHGTASKAACSWLGGATPQGAKQAVQSPVGWIWAGRAHQHIVLHGGDPRGAALCHAAAEVMATMSLRMRGCMPADLPPTIFAHLLALVANTPTALLAAELQVRCCCCGGRRQQS